MEGDLIFDAEREGQVQISLPIKQNWALIGLESDLILIESPWALTGFPTKSSHLRYVKYKIRAMGYEERDKGYSSNEE
jgi:hypothetical protein